MAIQVKVTKDAAGEKEFMGDLLEIIRAAANDVVTEAKRLAPVKTGALRDSIHTVEEQDGIYVGSELHYAKFQELGTRFISSRPFLRPAVYKVLNDSK